MRYLGGRLRWIWRGGAALVFLLAVATLASGGSVSTESSYWVRIVVWGGARFDDFATKFPSRPITNGTTSYQFRPPSATPPPYLATITPRQDTSGRAASLPDFLAAHATTAFLVLQGEQLLYEGYFNGAEHNSTQSSFSVAKSFGAALIGIAIGEGKINSADDPITRYLPELANWPGLEAITIRNLVSMTSGLRYSGDGVGGGPFSDDARSYYDPDLRQLALGVEAEVPPGTRWQYNNFHPILLGMILERATGRSVSAFLSEKLWQPLEAEAPGSWSLDSRHDGFEKMESGLNGRAIDFAKFGLLYLRGGTWRDRQLVPAARVAASARGDLTRGLPGMERFAPLGYGLMWWLDGKAAGRFFAMGNMGQFIYVAPDHDAVLVRFGTSTGGLGMPDWIGMLLAISHRGFRTPAEAGHRITAAHVAVMGPNWVAVGSDY